ncbi:MAG TPA: hypothetical protein VF472_16440 [Burkholderiaceae bacterium]
MPPRFKIFGQLIRVEKHADGWRPYYGGNDGKKRPADFSIPPDLAEEELLESLADLFHEHARPGNDESVRLN